MIKDASQVPSTEPTTPIVYEGQDFGYGQFFPDGQPRDRIYPDHLRALGQSLEERNVPSVVLDVEYGAFNVYDYAVRSSAMNMMIEALGYIRESYTGKLGYYGCLARRLEPARVIREKRPVDVISRKLALEDEHDIFIRPLVEAVDVIYPVVYGNNVWNKVDELGSDEVRERMYITYNLVYTNLYTYHYGTPAEWFICGDYDLEWQIRALKPFGLDINVWTGAQTPLNSYKVGLIRGLQDGN